MSYQRSQTPTTAPLQAPTGPQNAPAFSPLLALQGLVGNAGVLDMLRPQMPGAQRERRPTPLTGAVQSVLQQGASTLTPPPAGTETPSSVVAKTLVDQGQGAAITSAPSSPAQSAAAAVGASPSEVQAQAREADESSGWDEAVDWTVGGVGGLVDGGVELLSDVPVLGTAAATMAPVTKFAWETLGGFAKGAGDMVGGIANIVAHPLDFLEGMGTMLEHIPGSPLKVIHKLYDVAAGNKTLKETFWRNPIDVLTEDLGGDYDFWAKVVGAVIDPYERSVEQGRYGEAIGRGIFDIGSMFVGAGEVKALGKGAEAVSVLNKVDDAVKVASKVNELGAVTDDIVRAGGKVDDLTKVASHADEAADLSKADDATKLGNQVEDTALSLPSEDQPASLVAATDDAVVAEAEASQRVATHTDDVMHQPDDVAVVDVDESGQIVGQVDDGGMVTDRDHSKGSFTSDATRQHVHKGGTVTDPQSPYFGKWDGGGIHDWDGLVSRCAEDGFRVLEVAEDPASGVRRVKVERRGINPRDQLPISGKFKKTVYPKNMSAEQIDLAGEEALQRAMQGAEGTKFEPPSGKVRRNGSQADGYFEAEVLTPSGQPVRIQGWFSETPDGQRIISSHAPCYKETWPQLPQAEW